LKEKYHNSVVLFTIIIIFTFIGVTVGNPRHAEATALGERELKWGTKGEDVKDLQEMLSQKGFNPGIINGIYGPRTASAVRQFQLSRGLRGTGVADTATINRLETPTIKVAAAVENVPALSSDDMLLLARAVYGEARGEPYVGQVAIAAVIMNRVNHPSFPNSIPDVIFQPGAFTSVSDGQIWLEPNPTAFKAATDALSGWDPSNGAIYYWNPAVATSRWIWTRPIHTRIGKHVFGT